MPKFSYIPWVCFIILYQCSLIYQPKPKQQEDTYLDSIGEQGDIVGDDITENEGCFIGYSLCNGECVDTNSNYYHCGSCNHSCGIGEVCDGGACINECSGGRIECSGSCVDTNNDLNNCGGCGIVCTAGLRAQPNCSASSCSIFCDAGWSDLDGDGSCETNCIPSSPDEICNGLDDNCDGMTDEGFECILGTNKICGRCGSQSCVTGCILSNCTGESGVCTPDETLACTIGQCSGIQRCSTLTCTWESCDIGSPPINDTCETFIDVTAGGFFEGTTCGANSNYNLSSEGIAGPEVIYRMSLTSQSNIYIHTCNTPTPWPMGITITEGACGVAYSRDSRACGPGGGAKVEIALNSGTYYIAVGGTGATNVGSFTLFVSIMPL